MTAAECEPARDLPAALQSLGCALQTLSDVVFDLERQVKRLSDDVAVLSALVRRIDNRQQNFIGALRERIEAEITTPRASMTLSS